MPSLLKHSHIPLQGTPNMRDLGGYPTRCGQQIRHNQLFRSGLLTHLTDEDWDTLYSLGIRTICDFRSEEEQRDDPTLTPESMPIRVVSFAIAPASRGSLIQQSLSADSFSAAVSERVMESINEAFATEFTATFRQFIEELLEAKSTGSLLFHCTAGKDRTGFAAAIVLGCLNVEREIIEKEYAITRHYFNAQQRLEETRKKYPMLNEAGIDPNALIPLFDARPNYIAAALNKIDEHWGGMDSYLHDALGLDANTLNELRDHFLESH